MSTIHLDGRNSFSSLGLALTYLWSFGSIPSGSATTLSSTTTSTVSFVPDIAGVYNVKLIVNDGTTSSVATYSVNTLVLLSGTSTVVYTNNTSGIYIVNGNGHNIGTIPSITLPFGATGTFDWDGYSWGYSGSDGTIILHPAILTFATLDPTKAGLWVVLSNGNLTAHPNAMTVLSTIGKSAGKWYWEYHLDIYDQLNAKGALGIALSTVTVNELLGFDSGGYAYVTEYNSTGPFPPSYTYHTRTVVSYGAIYSVNDVIGVALDMDAGTLTFYLNGVSQGVAFTGLSGAFYAGVSCDEVPDVFAVTANFGATAFTYSVPSGYNSGLYT